MERKTKPASRRPATHWWRTVFSGLCIALAAVSLILSIATRYTRDNVLDTDQFVTVVGQLPAEPAVAEALATYATGALFDAGDAEARIKEFLPPRLGPVASPLTDMLEEKVNETASDFIASDAFNALWTTTLRTTHTGIMKVAESEPLEEGELRERAFGSVDLSAIIEKIRERFGDEQAVVGTDLAARTTTLKVNLRQSADQLRTSVRLVENAAAVLPYVFVALSLAGIAVAWNRRRAVLGVGLTIFGVGAIMVLVFKVGSTELLQTIQQTLYRDAAEVIYRAFYDDMSWRLGWAMTIGMLVALVAIACGPYKWAAWLRGQVGLPKLRRTKAYRWAQSVRDFTKTYANWLYLGGIGIALITMLALPSITLSTLIVITSWLVAYLAAVQLVAKPSPSRR